MISEISIQVKISSTSKTGDNLIRTSWETLYVVDRPKIKKWGMESTFCNFKMNAYAQS